MSAFFELRTYKVFPGKMKEWIKFMENEIIPFQVSKGMVIHGSFTVENDDETYVWIRRFENESQRELLYSKVYESDKWINEMVKNVEKLIDRDATIVKRLNSTEISVMK
tara:strand:+ start:3476 stop:3802 length:327 start_codon:yes stop_codon:yes gene_type:complete